MVCQVKGVMLYGWVLIWKRGGCWRGADGERTLEYLCDKINNMIMLRPVCLIGKVNDADQQLTKRQCCKN
jgi:hypothetical protein